MKWIKFLEKMINLSNVYKMEATFEGVYLFCNGEKGWINIPCKNLEESKLLLNKIHVHIESPDTTLDLT